MKDCFRECTCNHSPKSPIKHCRPVAPDSEVCINCEESLFNQEADEYTLSPVELVALYPMMVNRMRNVAEDNIYEKVRKLYLLRHHPATRICPRIPENLVRDTLVLISKGGITGTGVRFMGDCYAIHWGPYDKDDPKVTQFQEQVSITGWTVTRGTHVQWGRIMGSRKELYKL